MVRALIKPEGIVGPVLRWPRDGDYEIVLIEQLLTELVDVLNRPRIKKKYGLDTEDIETALALLLLRGRTVSPVEPVDVCREPKG